MPNGGQASGMALVPKENTDYVFVCNFVPEYVCKLVKRADWQRDKLDATAVVALTDEELRLLAWFVPIWRDVQGCGYHMPGVDAEFWIG